MKNIFVVFVALLLITFCSTVLYIVLDMNAASLGDAVSSLLSNSPPEASSSVDQPFGIFFAFFQIFVLLYFLGKNA